MNSFIQNYDNKLSLSNINKFIKCLNIKLSSEESAKLNSVFNECDKQDADGENAADGVLNKQERTTFLMRIKATLPQIFSSIRTLSDYTGAKEDEESTNQAVYEGAESIGVEITEVREDDVPI